jgi:Trypsin
MSHASGSEGRVQVRRPRILLAATAFALAAATAVPANAAPMPLAGPGARPVIVGGTPIDVAESPWQALIVVDRAGTRSLCSGSLITPTVIVTAGHCLTGVGADSVKAWLGETSLAQAAKTASLPIAGIAVHPGYGPDTYANDIALITLAKPVDITGSVRLIGLPFGQDAATWPAAGTPAIISGWGATSTGGQAAGQLLRADVQVLAGPGAPCGQYGAGFDPTMLICGGLPDGSRDTCQGDSGGPFVVAVAGLPVLAGLTSSGSDCAVAAYPGEYTRLTTFLPWIQQSAMVATAPPGAATDISATARAGRMVVAWTPPAETGPGSTVWTVTSEPGGQTCRTTGRSCAISGLRAGTSAAFSVQGSGPLGTGPAASSARVVVATTQARRGSAVSVRALGSWLRIGRARAVSRTPAVCRVAGARVVLRRPGTCTLVVAGGGKRRAAVISVV